MELVCELLVRTSCIIFRNTAAEAQFFDVVAWYATGIFNAAPLRLLIIETEKREKTKVL
jgi:hypothetical protein